MIIKYPRFFALFLTIIITVLIFNNENLVNPENFVVVESYLSAFTLGILYVYGFTSALATGALLTIAKTQNIFLTGIIGGLGSVIGDLIIFRFIRTSFNGEIEEIGKTKLLKRTRKFLKEHAGLNKTVPIIAYIFIASPLPDEIGVSLIATYKDTTAKSFTIISYMLNTIGIFTILIIGKLA